MIKKIFGWISVIVGLLFIISFPSVRDYMPDEFANAGIVFGFFLVALGIFLIQL
jgi:hypothetical protein